jgi:lipopolysaccharide export system protein LptA
VIKHRLPIFLAVAVACSSALAEEPGEKPLTEAELIKQIEALNPGLTAAAQPSTSIPVARPVTRVPVASPLPDAPAPAPAPATTSTTTGTMIKPPSDPASVGATDTTGKPEKKSKGPTEINALEATFDQKNSVAVFIGSVVVKDPEFNVVCDKLTAFLKHEDKSAPAVAAGSKTTPKPATPTPDASASKKKGGGLDKAIAVTTSDRRVIITQDKVEADGSVTHGIGRADIATYDATTGDIVLKGSPDVTQGLNRCIATDPSTVMTLNRDGHMKASGPHKTIITSEEDRGTAKGNPQ